MKKQKNIKKLFEQVLFEDRADYAAKQFGAKVVTAMKNDHSASRFTDENDLVRYLNNNISSVYVLWVTKMYSLGLFKIEDAQRIKDELIKFDKVKSKLENKDLNSYKSLNQLYDVLDKFDDADTVSKNQAIKNIKNNDAEVYYKDKDLTVIIPKTKEASCLYGAGTRWCTAAENNNQFDNYNSRGNLYILIVKNGDKEDKYQFQFETQQYMDDKDVQITPAIVSKLSKIPGYKNFLNKRIHEKYDHYVK